MDVFTIFLLSVSSGALRSASHCCCCCCWAIKAQFHCEKFMCRSRQLVEWFVLLSVGGVAWHCSNYVAKRWSCQMFYPLLSLFPPPLATHLNALKSQIRCTNFISIVCKFHLQSGRGERVGAAEAAAGHHHDEHPANVSNLQSCHTLVPSPLSQHFPSPKRRAVFRSFPLAISSYCCCCCCCCFSHLNAFQKSEKPKNLFRLRVGCPYFTWVSGPGDYTK